MTFYVENEVDAQFPFDVEEVIQKVAMTALEQENCPYEVEVNVLITDNDGIRELNREYREIDRETDVLSFPNVDYEAPGYYTRLEEDEADYFNPDSGELMLGDIILSEDRIREQAEEYGHSVLREFAFLVAHSMLHLLGYDHMVPEEAKVMEEKQEKILNTLKITRD
ncbi:MAG: rRNA maturation RNase YbeY [Lachnospiraceae bacterium]|nr:rRNA maturation RNase YbeY [Lachnospiraceae bacterium]